MLAGRSTLVVEDEYLIALEIQRVLEGAGAVATIGAGISSIDLDADTDRFDLAVVSIRPDSVDEHALCQALRDQGTAVVALSGANEHSGGVPGLEAIPVVIKPFTDEELIAAALVALDATRPESEPVS